MPRVGIGTMMREWRRYHLPSGRVVRRAWQADDGIALLASDSWRLHARRYRTAR